MKLFLWKFPTFLHNISICQTVSSQPTECLGGKFYFFSKEWCGWCMKPETTNVSWVARLLPALNDQRRDFWEVSCLYLAINQTQGKGRGWRLLQVMDCWLATILISSVHLTSLHSDGYFCISVSGPGIFSSLTWNEVIVSIAVHEIYDEYLLSDLIPNPWASLQFRRQW